MRYKLRLILLVTMTSTFFGLLFIFLLPLRNSQHCHRDDGSNCDSNNGDKLDKKMPSVNYQAEEARVINNEHNIHEDARRTQPERPDAVHLSVVACGDRLPETLIMIKSAVLLTRVPLHVHIFAETDLRPKFKQELDSWPRNVTGYLTYHLYDIQFPEGQKVDEWKQLFKLCASQRIFIPDILTSVDALLYVDTDVLFLRSVSDIWRFFSKFNESQIAAMTQEHEEPSASWYARSARHPYVPPYGINSGVMLMNLTRMRQVNFIQHIMPYYKKHKFDITWGDQDLINIYFHYFPEKLYQFQCQWNYRPDHCMYMSTCHPAEQHGVFILHGNRGVFHNDKQPAFKAVYDSIKQLSFEAPLSRLLQILTHQLQQASDTRCGRLSDIFLKQVRRQANTSKDKVTTRSTS